MDTLISAFQGGLSYIVPMVILLGLIIFIHEMGHFLVAKYYKVRVETFSLGFGPKLFKFTRGETTYALSAIPLGGYVKMFGDEVGGDVQADQRPYAFTHKPVGQRIAIVLAGPLMNFFFAIVLFMLVALVGEQTLAPKVGDVAETSPAYKAGFRSGDEIVAIAGEPVKTWDAAQRAIEASGGRSLQIQVKREVGDAAATIAAEPKVVANKNVLSWDERVGEIEGLSYSSRASAIGVSDPRSIAGKAGLRTGDVIASVNGAKVDKWRELEREVAKSTDGKLAFGITRNSLTDKPGAKEETVNVDLTLPDQAKGKSAVDELASLGIENPELYLASLPEEKSFLSSLGIKKPEQVPAAVAGLREGDKLLSVNGTKASNFDEVAKQIRAYGGDGPLTISYLRDGEERRADVVPNMRSRTSTQGREETRYEIGIRPMIVDATPATVELVTRNPIAAVQRGVSQTLKWTSLTALSFLRLFQNQVSAKNIGGFLSIGQMAKKSWQMGPAQFLNIMGIISINLFLLNLLPVPVLDGGHLAFYSIEAARGAPLSMKKLEMAQQVGLVLLLGLMAFALFNDFSRLFGG